MGRPLRNAVGGVVYHLLNRANARATIFENNADHAAFLRILGEAGERVGMRLLAYCACHKKGHSAFVGQEKKSSLIDDNLDATTSCTLAEQPMDWQYTWDAENHLIEVAPADPVEDDVKLNFVHDYRSRRVARQAHHWDGAEWDTDVDDDLQMFVYDERNGGKLTASLFRRLSSLVAG